jgi:hypothetical protein
MLNPSDFLALLRSTDFADAYYDLCRRFPLRLDLPTCKAPAPQVVKIGRNAGALKRVKGPVRGFEFIETFSANGHLAFAIQAHGTSIEVFWERDFRSQRLGDTFAALAHELKTMEGEAAIPNPPCSRPDFHSLDELQEILTDIVRQARIIFSIGN